MGDGDGYGPSEAFRDGIRESAATEVATGLRDMVRGMTEGSKAELEQGRAHLDHGNTRYQDADATDWVNTSVGWVRPDPLAPPPDHMGSPPPGAGSPGDGRGDDEGDMPHGEYGPPEPGQIWDPLRGEWVWPWDDRARDPEAPEVVFD